MPGERVIEAEIARQMAISRAPIREAIRKLERDGLVEYHPRRGTVVIQLSIDEVRDVYYLRAHLEVYAARLAATRLTEQDFEDLEGLIEQMKQCAAENKLRDLLVADVAFHARICRASGSKRAYSFWDSLNPHAWTLLTSLKAEYSLSDIAERHRAILDALRTRDPDQVEAAIRSHIIDLAEAVLDHLVSTEAPKAPGTSRSRR